MTSPKAFPPIQPAPSTPPELSPTRGVLAPPPDGTWSLIRHEPGSALAPYVSWLWSVSWDLTDHGDHVQATLPHPSAHLVVEDGSVNIYGPTGTRFERLLSGKGRVTALRFRPGGLRPLIDQAMSGLVDQSLPARQLLPGLAADLATSVETVPDPDAALDLLESTVEVAIQDLAATNTNRAGANQADDRVVEVERLVDRIIEDRSITSVARLAEAAALHPRSLQRLFADYVGIGPKAVIQRHRLQDAAAIALSGDPVDWAQVAAELGYYDQAHLVRDFTAVIGQPPNRYAETHRS